MAPKLSIRFRAAAVLAVALFLLTQAFSVSAAPAARFTPVIPGVEVSPPPGEMLESGQAIQVRLSGDLALPGTAAAQAFIDTRQATLEQNGPDISITVPDSLPGGLHQIRLVIPAVVGSAREVKWSLQAPAPVEAELRDASVAVTVNAKRTLYEGDLFEVKATGPAGGRATATQGNFSMALTETAPGQYSASRIIERADYSSAATTRVRVTLPNGQVVGNGSEKDVKVFGRMFSIRIESPVSGSKVPYNFVIRGRTRPHARVSIAPRVGVADSPAMMSVNQNIRPSSTTGQTLSQGMGGYDLQADAEGRFEQKFGFPIHIFDISYSFLITARDNGEQAVPCTLYVTLTNNTTPTPAASPSPRPSPAKGDGAPTDGKVQPYR